MLQSDLALVRWVSQGDLVYSDSNLLHVCPGKLCEISAKIESEYTKSLLEESLRPAQQGHTKRKKAAPELGTASV